MYFIISICSRCIKANARYSYITCPLLFSTQILLAHFPRDAAGAERFPPCRSLLLLAVAAQSIYRTEDGKKSGYYLSHHFLHLTILTIFQYEWAKKERINAEIVWEALTSWGFPSQPHSALWSLVFDGWTPSLGARCRQHGMSVRGVAPLALGEDEIEFLG